MSSRRPPDAATRLTSCFFMVGRALHEYLPMSDAADTERLLQMETMRYILERKNPSMTEVALHLCITRPSATALMNGLIRNGFVRRVRGGSDRRMVRVEISNKGKRRLEVVIRQIIRDLRPFYARLSPREQAQLIRLLERLVGDHILRSTPDFPASP